jgi:starch phosphorylase
MAALDPFLERRRIAYLSIEIALRPEIHTYSGGLGILAGDVARTCADLSLPMVLVTLVSRKGYLRQDIDSAGQQVDSPDPWEPADWATPLDAMVAVEIEGRQVWIRSWLHVVDSAFGGDIPVILLDTDVDQNHPDDRAITDNLYGGDALHRLRQEAILGIGAARILRALGFEVGFYHLNEGHAALLAVELLRRTRNPAAEERDRTIVSLIRLRMRICVRNACSMSFKFERDARSPPTRPSRPAMTGSTTGTSCAS